jgi:hypothetical protein
MDIRHHVVPASLVCLIASTVSSACDNTKCDWPETWCEDGALWECVEDRDGRRPAETKLSDDCSSDGNVCYQTDVAPAVCVDPNMVACNPSQPPLLVEGAGCVDGKIFDWQCQIKGYYSRKLRACSFGQACVQTATNHAECVAQ